jgi:Tol biopolymer transport system component
LPEASFADLSFSPDGRRIAYVISQEVGGSDFRVSLHDLVVGATSEITRVRGFSSGLVWLPTGRELLFRAGVSDTVQYIARARVDGSGRIDTLSRSTDRQEFRTPISVTPDGRHLLLQVTMPSNNDLVVASLDSLLGAPRGYLVANWSESSGRISPDGRWVAYQSTEEAPLSDPFRTKVYVRSFPEPGERYTVSDSIGRNPRWAPDGRTIYFWRGATMVAASVVRAPTFRVTGRRDLFTRTGGPSVYDISPDGKQFVMTAPSAGASGTPTVFEPFRLVVVGNWIEELRRKLGEERK